MLTEKNDYRSIRIELNALIRRNNYEIKYLKTYLSSSTESLKEKERELKDKMNEDAEKSPDDEPILQELFSNEIYKVSSYYYHSSIVLIYTFLESALYSICSEIQSKTGARFCYKDLFGNNIIKKSKYYLELTTSLSFEETNKSWDRITQYQKLRNYIIHQNSTITDKKVMEKFKLMFPQVEIINDSFFIRDHTLALEFLDTIDNFLDFIYQNIKTTPFLGKVVEEQTIIEDSPF